MFELILPCYLPLQFCLAYIKTTNSFTAKFNGVQMQNKSSVNEAVILCEAQHRLLNRLGDI